MRTIIALLLLTCFGPVAASAQAPPFLAQWGAFGTGDGQFGLPVGVAVDANEIVYVADQRAGRILAFTSMGQHLTSWPSPAPACIAVDPAGNIWVGDHETNRLRAYSPGGALLQDWASPGYRLAPDPSGNIWVLDYWRHRVCLFTPAGSPLLQWGTPGLAPGQISTPSSIAVDHAGNVYVSDIGRRVQVFTSDGTFLRGWSSPERLEMASRLTIRREVTLLATDTFNDRVVAFDPFGGYLYTLGGSGTGPGQFRNPIGVAVGPSGAIYVADANNGRIQVFGDQTTAATHISWGALKRDRR